MAAWLLRYERFIELVLLIGLLLFARRAWMAWQDLQRATFRLEEEHARQRLQQSVIGMLLSAALMLTMFTVAALGWSTPAAAPLPSAANTTPESTSGSPTATPTALAEALEAVESQCDPQQVNITAPTDGQVVQGEVDIRGTATAPNFGFYKVEFAPVDQPLFLTIEVGRTPKQDDVLVQQWDTTLLPPGAYWLQLVVVDNAGNPLPPCRVQVEVRPAE